MDDQKKRMLAMMFGDAAPIMDLETCAKVLYKPFKHKKDHAWLPIGWEAHQPMLFVTARDEVKQILDSKGREEINLTIRSYVCMDVLPDELRSQIREHLKLEGSDESSN